MNESIIDILLVEDNPHDVELTMEALQARKLANRVKVLRDGEEAFIIFSGQADIKNKAMPERIPY
ncbi:MAG TPA: hypothetical protein VMT12_05905 [Syntrophales bacterium]|nr:hypothetical protein [Syntrophales bacterium]